MEQNLSVTTLIIYTKKLFNFDWLRKECKMCNTSVKMCNTRNTRAKSVIQCKLHIAILDYDWLMNNRVWSGPMNLLFSNQARALDGAVFPDCMIRERFFCLRTEHSEVRTKTTEGQYSPVRPEQARLVSC